MVTGTMARGKVVHIGKHITTRPGAHGEPVKLYEPICTKMRQFHHLTYLLTTKEPEPVTCTKCQARQAKYPHMYT